MKNLHFRLLSALVVAGVAVSAASAADPSDDDVIRIARQIQRQIVTLPTYGVFDNISFGLQGSAVILQGQASRPTLRTSAERVVKRIEGVEEVINEIEVLPLSGADDRIRAEVYARIYGNSALSRYNPNRGNRRWITPTRIAGGITNDPPPGFHPIHIIVRNGHVRLEGVVDTASDKVIAGMQANLSSGVFAVSNDLDVSNEGQKGDKE